jgi:hypothetical protein
MILSYLFRCHVLTDTFSDNKGHTNSHRRCEPMHQRFLSVRMKMAPAETARRNSLPIANRVDREKLEPRCGLQDEHVSASVRHVETVPGQHGRRPRRTQCTGAEAGARSR